MSLNFRLKEDYGGFPSLHPPALFIRPDPFMNVFPFSETQICVHKVSISGYKRNKGEYAR